MHRGLLLALLAGLLVGGELDPPLPGAGEAWHADPWTPVAGGVDEFLDNENPTGHGLGPFTTGGNTWEILVSMKPPHTATVAGPNTGEKRNVPLQFLHGRVIIGPVGPGGAVLSPEGGGHHWLLVRQGRVRLLTRTGQPLWIEDELAFDLRWFAVDLSALDAEGARRWAEAFWTEEGRRLEVASRPVGP